MKSMKKVIAIVCVFVMMTMTLTGCSVTDAMQIRGTLKDFQKAATAKDVDGMLECIEPETATYIGWGMDLIGLFTGSDRDQIFDSIAELVFNVTEGSDFLENMSIKKPKLEIDGSEAVVSADMNYTLSGEEYTDRVAVNMVKIEKKWYISSVNFQ